MLLPGQAWCTAAGCAASCRCAASPAAANRPLPTLLRCAAATQVASRLFVLWGVVDLVPEAHRRPLVLAQWGQTYLELSLLSLLVAWCCSEIIRYSFFAFKVSRLAGVGEKM